MATESTTYIQDLDPVLELQPTDSFVVETLDGTRRILFKDFILGQDNVDFYEEIAQNSLDILSLSSEYTSLNTSLSVLSTSVDTLSASVSDSLKYGFCYVTFNNVGTMSIVSSSTNVSSITNTDGGSRVKVELSGSLDIDLGSINVTLDTTLSASAVTTAFELYSPLITDRNTSYFKVGINNCVFGGNTSSLSAVNLGNSSAIKLNNINISFRYN